TSTDINTSPTLEQISLSCGVPQGAPLPVGLLFFKATVQGNNVLLNWSTSSEQNNRGFAVQRSTDGTNWQEIGFVSGSGTSTSANSYSYTDKGLNPDVYYYRLKQVDFDNKFKFSPVATAVIAGSATIELNQNYPNPYATSTSIEFVLPESMNVKLTVLD